MTNRILDILHAIRPDADFSTSTDFIAEGLLDSFDMMMLVAELDKEFSVSIDGTDIVPENFDTVEGIRRVLLKHGVDA
jgi:acyl carrier protein